MLCAIKLPTIINEGAVIAATLDKEAITGLKNAVIIVRPTTTIPVNPVLPPAQYLLMIQSSPLLGLFQR